MKSIAKNDDHDDDDDSMKFNQLSFQSLNAECSNKINFKSQYEILS